jgi:tyrosyl-tRNA synthetase
VKNKFLQEIEARGLLYQASNMDGINDALNAGAVTAYWGTDPTGDSLHVGHAASLMLMRWFQKMGHKPILLVGGATGRIGDPSGRDKGRPMLTDETLEKNLAGLKKSISKFVRFGNGPTDAIMVDNIDWMKKYGHIEFLAEYGTDFTVPRMLSMESVKKRLETGMTFLEFNYMTFQAVDFLQLYKKHHCILQFCGADQWGNSIMGVELIRKKLRAEAFVLSCPLITDATGEKIGKSAGNAVWVNEDKTSPFEYYQYFRNVMDADVEKFMKIFTELPLDDIARLAALPGTEINEAKKILAFEATKIAHGESAAKDATAAAAALFGTGTRTSAIPTVDLSRRQVPDNMTIVDFAILAGFFPSKSEARRMIDQGGLMMNGKRISTPDEAAVIDANNEIMLQKGKKTFLRVVVK